MRFFEYGLKAIKTDMYPSGDNLPYAVLGLVGEAGEVANLVKKKYRGDRINPDYFRTKLMHELGDVLWYMNKICWEIGCDLCDIAEMNLAKLRGRIDRGTILGEGDER